MCVMVYAELLGRLGWEKKRRSEEKNDIKHCIL